MACCARGWILQFYAEAQRFGIDNLPWLGQSMGLSPWPWLSACTDTCAFVQYPGCGRNPLRLVSNQAGRMGGGLYTSSCYTLEEGKGVCFLGNIRLGYEPSWMVLFQGNSAAGGGGYFSECQKLGPCAALMDKKLGLPSRSKTYSSILEFRDNSAILYGGRAASTANELVVAYSEIDGIRLVPGQDNLNVTLLLLDSLRQQIDGTIDPYVIEMTVCTTESSGCSSISSLQPALFMAFDGNQVRTAERKAVLQYCTIESSTVIVHISVLNQDENLGATLEVECLPCRPGQSRTMISDAQGGAGQVLWSCESCSSGEYVIDPNRHSCTPCPVGALCDGTGQYPRVEGSVWKADFEFGVYRLITCPTGYQMVNTTSDGSFAQELQDCSPCPPGQECKAQACQTCQLCSPGFFKSFSGTAECEACPVNTYRTEPGAVDLSLCLQCPVQSSTRGQKNQNSRDSCICNDAYYREANVKESQCVECPKAALCEASRLCLLRGWPEVKHNCSGEKGLVGTWRVDNTTGRYVVTECPRGHELRTTASTGSPELQECHPCETNEYILNQVHTCQTCPPGLQCDGTDEVEPLVGSNWTVDAGGSFYVLQSCSSGYSVSAGDPSDTQGNNGFNAALQQCLECPEGQECTVPPCLECSPCQPGHYKDSAGTAPCGPCPVDTYRAGRGATDVEACQLCPPDSSTWDSKAQTTIDACKCREGLYWNDQTSECGRCPVQTECPYNTSLTTLVIVANFWRDTLTTSRLYACNVDSSGSSTCLGSNQGVAAGQTGRRSESVVRDSDRYCAYGHRGPLCTVCLDQAQYFDRATAHCRDCSGLSTAGLVLLVIVAFLVLLFLAVQKFEFLGRGARSIHAFARKNTLQAKFKIILSFAQVFNTLESVYGVQWHNDFSSWLEFLNVANFDPLELVLPGSCVGSMQERLALSALWPVVAALLISLVILVYGSLVHRGKGGAIMADTSWSTLYVSVLIVYVVLPTVSRSIFAAKQCVSFSSDDLTGKNSYLFADLDIRCSQSNADYRGLNISFWIYFVLWPVMVPLLLLLLLLWSRSSGSEQRNLKLALETRFLWQDYASEFHYWEVVDLIRKLLLTALVLFVDTEFGSSRVLRLGLALIVSATYLTMLACARPFKRSEDLYLACTSNLFLICCFVSGFFIKLCEEPQWANIVSCQTFLGLSGSYDTTVFAIVLTVAMLAISLIVITLKVVFAITAPTIRVAWSGREPNLELPASCKFHCFLSHTWSTGQDQTHTLSRKLQLLLTDVKCWLDVDNLEDVGKLEVSVSESAVFILFLSKNYFKSANCRRELYTAVALGKPIIVVHEVDEQKGGASQDEMKAECRAECNDVDEYNRVETALPSELLPHNLTAYTGPEQLIDLLFDQNEPIVWVRVHDFQIASLKCIVLRMLQHLPHYQRYPDELGMGLKVPGELPACGFSSPVTLIVLKDNEGALEVARELEHDSGVHSKAARILVEECDALTGGTDKARPGETMVLLYLNERTFSDPNGTLAASIKHALDRKLFVVLVHEQDASKGGCPFGTLIAHTPKELQLPPYKLFDTLAVPYFPSKHHGIISRRHILRMMGAKPLRIDSQPEAPAPLHGHGVSPSQGRLPKTVPGATDRMQESVGEPQGFGLAQDGGQHLVMVDTENAQAPAPQMHHQQPATLRSLQQPAATAMPFQPVVLAGPLIHNQAMMPPHLSAQIYPMISQELQHGFSVQTLWMPGNQ